MVESFQDEMIRSRANYKDDLNFDIHPGRSSSVNRYTFNFH
jgi:hypothetical protein